MISVDEARERILSAFAPLPSETLSIAQGLGRVLAQDLSARLTQPPKDVSAMDGYAVRSQDLVNCPVELTLVGSAPAGGHFDGELQAGETVRIFTGGPMPAGTDAVVIQEKVSRANDRITVAEPIGAGRNVRLAGLDFRQGDKLLTAGKRLSVRDLALAAAMNHAWLSVHREPRVAILATGDELAMPGDPMGEDQIVSSNSLALSAFVRAGGGNPVILGIARDETQDLEPLLTAAKGADLLVTTGGVSVGDRDLLSARGDEFGLEVDFWKIAMRPGKPLLFGRLAGTPLLALPGNPVSVLVCAFLFLGPLLRKLSGENQVHQSWQKAKLDVPLGANDWRESYLRGNSRSLEDGNLAVAPVSEQDSSMLAVMAQSDCLIRRAANAQALEAGCDVEVTLFSKALFSF